MIHCMVEFGHYGVSHSSDETHVLIQLGDGASRPGGTDGRCHRKETAITEGWYSFCRYRIVVIHLIRNEKNSVRF